MLCTNVLVGALFYMKRSKNKHENNKQLKLKIIIQWNTLQKNTIQHNQAKQIKAKNKPKQKKLNKTRYKKTE